jgi:crossover junction endodeoxyribonuclease RuvC
MIIVGIDPGYDRLGIAVLEKKGTGGAVLHSECFTTKASLPLPVRLSLVQEKVREVLIEYKPTVLAIETLYFSSNKKTAISVAEARGVILAEAAAHKITIEEYAPGTIKVAVAGDGRATKEGVMRMVPLLTKLPHATTSDDELDAIAVGLTACAILK